MRKRRVTSVILLMCFVVALLPINVFAMGKDKTGAEQNTAETQATMNIWDGSIADSYAGGNGSSGSPFQIETPSQLARMSEQVKTGADNGKFFKLNCDIYLNDISDFDRWDLNAPQNSWTPIASAGTPFSGGFDGGNHTIYGIYISSSDNYQGLFASVRQGQTTKNINVDKSYIKGNDCVGGIFGHSVSHIENCSSSATVIGHNYVGGIIGKADAPYGLFDSQPLYIDNCRNTGDISGENYVGGLLGICDYGYFNRQCYNTGAISGKGKVGGIAGKAMSANTCWNAGKITGVSCVGGILGEATYYGRTSSSITSSFNAGSINGTSFVGGLLGYSTVYSGFYPSNMSNCYNVGEITGTGENVGGIAGQGYLCIYSNIYNAGQCSLGTGTNVSPICKYGVRKEADNMFFLAGCCGKNFNNTQSYVIGKTFEEMVSSDFVSQLNKGGSAFKQDTEGYNAGYPILNGIDYTIFAEFKKNTGNAYSIVEAVRRYTTGKTAQRLTEIEKMNISQEEKMRLLVELFGLDDITEIREGVEYIIDSKTERWAYNALMSDDMYCANNYREYVASHPEVQVELLLSSLIFAGEIQDWIDINTYLESDYPGVSKYKTMLLDFMEYSQESIKSISVVKDINSFLKNATKLTQETVIAELDKCDTYREMLYFLSSHHFREIVLNTDKEHLTVINGTPFITKVELDKDSGFGKFAKRVKNVDKLISIGDVALSTIRDVIEFDSVLALYEKYDDFLSEVSSAKELPVGMRVAALQLQKDLKDGYLGKVLDVATVALEQFLDFSGAKNDVITSALESLGISSFADFLSTVKMVAWFINKAADVGETVNASATTEAYAKLGAYYKKKLEGSEKRFLQNETEENAWDFYYNYTMLWNIRNAGEDAYLGMCNIDGLLSFLFERQYKEKEKVVNDTKRILKRSEFVKIKMSESQEKEKLYESKTIIECPVDVSIYDNYGNLVVTLKDGSECDIVNTFGRFISKYRSFNNDYVKVLYWDSCDGYNVKLTATGDGIVSVSQLKADSSCQCDAFYNVAINQSDTMIFDPSNSSKAFVSSQMGAESEIASVKINLDVNKTINVVAVELPQSIELSQGSKRVLPVSIEPRNATYQDIYWFTSDDSVVTVNNGVVSAVGGGEAKITCVTEDGELSSVCLVRVDSSHIITLDPVGGVLTPQYLVTDIRGCLSTIPDPTRTGYAFLGWFTSPTGGTQVTTDTTFTQDTTIYAHWQENSSSGGSGNRPTISYFSVNIEKAEHGSVTAKPATASPGDIVNLVVEPDEGFKLAEVVVVDEAGKEVALTGFDAQYSFRMPNGGVTVWASFCTTEFDEKLFPFVDVASDAWYADSVLYAYENGLMTGTSETTFSPNEVTTRGQLVTILYRMEGEPPVSNISRFDDVPSGQWYTNAVTWAADNGIVSGYGNRKYGPHDGITREQMVTILHRYADSKNVDTSKTVSLEKYSDQNQISSYAVTSMRWAVGEGLITGTSQTTLSPTGTSTRAQVAAILQRYGEKVTTAE